MVQVCWGIQIHVTTAQLNNRQHCLSNYTTSPFIYFSSELNFHDIYPFLKLNYMYLLWKTTLYVNYWIYVQGLLWEVFAIHLRYRWKNITEPKVSWIRPLDCSCKMKSLLTYMRNLPVLSNPVNANGSAFMTLLSAEYHC